MFYITIWYWAASYKERHQSLPHTRADMYTLPKSKQMSHQAHISPKFPNSQNRKHQAKLNLLRWVHTYHFHFDSVFLTYGFLSLPASPLLHISDLRRYNKLNLTITSAADTKGRRETQKQSWSFEGQTKSQFPPPRWAAFSWGCEPAWELWCTLSPALCHGLMLDSGKGNEAQMLTPLPGDCCLLLPSRAVTLLLFARLAQFAALAKPKLKWGFLSSFLVFCLACSFNALWLKVCKKTPAPLLPPEVKSTFLK